jgi:hypothetical protein
LGKILDGQPSPAVSSAPFQNFLSARGGHSRHESMFSGSF